MKSQFLDKLIARIDQIDPGSLQNYFLRLAQEKGLMETIFQAIQEGIIVLDGKGAISYANDRAQKLIGFRLEQAQGQPIGKYFREVDWDLVLDLDADEWSRLVTREIEISYPDHRFLEFYIVPMEVLEDKENGAVLILRDVTQDREKAASTLESERMNAIMLLAAGVAHEIGNPLNSLNIHLQLLDREILALNHPAPEELQELVQVARNEVTRLDQIINQFLRAIRPSQPQLEPVDIQNLLEETVAVVEQEVKDRGIWIELECDEHLPRVMMDKGQIRQAAFNLIKNALQSMDGGLLKITVMMSDEVTSIAFRDTGSGILPEDLGNIFEPYHTTKAEGTGLGLMIVQRIVRDHGGQVEIDTVPGKGTTVTLFFPRDENRIRLLPAPSKPTEASAE
ncbi:MAG: two-component system, sporulation sensor kinase E [Candidatus Omnitrophota bacterium]|jgi:two-component system, sporulation sensor kinase E